MIAISHPHCTRLSHISGDSVSVRGLGASVGASGRRNHAATTLVPRAKAKDTKDAKDTEEEKTVVKIPKAPARSVRSQSLQPLHKRVGWTGEREEIRKNGSPLNSNTTQGAHGMNYHHAQNTSGYYFFMPCVSLMGVGALNQAVSDMKSRGYLDVLIVTDKVLKDIGAVDRLTDLLSSEGIEYEIFDEITPNPTADQVRKGVEIIRKAKCSAIVSFGGGSPHDCAKGIALVATNGGDIKDYEGVDKSLKRMLPMVAINTTAGTASEMTRFCIITDTERHIKMAIVDWHTTPDIAVDDPSLMLEMPKSLTAATGLDALTHAMEAYVSTMSTPVTDACALHAIKLISTYLRQAVDDPSCLQGRDMMSYAEFLAGMAFNSASLGFVHAMAHQLGGFYNLPHGVCNAVLLPVVQARNAKHVPELFVDLARAMGMTHVGDNDAERAAQLVLKHIRSLSRDTGIPENLELLGVKRDDFGALADNAMKDACGATNPFQPTKEEVIEMFEEAFTQTY